jgi:hypothetical protein
MNEHEAFEMELASLKPRPASPELKRRIAQQLTQREPASVARQRGGAGEAWLVSLALGLALVVLAVISRRSMRPTPSILRFRAFGRITALFPPRRRKSTRCSTSTPAHRPRRPRNST